jgi:hypothetical protein
MECLDASVHEKAQQVEQEPNDFSTTMTTTGKRIHEEAPKH